MRFDGDGSQVAKVLEETLNPGTDLIGDPRSAEFRTAAAIERERLIAVLHGLGYYGGDVEVRVGDVPLPLAGATDEAADVKPGKVTYIATPGPIYLVRSFRVVVAGESANPEAGQPIDDVAGLPATAEALADVEFTWLANARHAGYAFADGVERQVRPDDDARMIDVTLGVDRGPLVRLGEVHFLGLLRASPTTLRAVVGFQPGDRYTPEDLGGLRTAVEAQPQIESARVQLSPEADEAGLYPVTVTVVERAVDGSDTPLDGLIGIAVLGASAISVAGVQVARARSGDSTPWSAHWYFYVIAALLAASAAMVCVRLLQFFG